MEKDIMQPTNKWYNQTTGEPLVVFDNRPIPEGYALTPPVKTSEQITAEKSRQLESLYGQKVDKLTLEAVLKKFQDDPMFEKAWAARMAVKEEVANSAA